MMYSACVWCVGGLIGPTKFIPHLAKALVAMIGHNDISSLATGGLVRWHCSQRFTNSNASICNVGHHNPDHRIAFAVSGPEKCPLAIPACA